MKRRDSPPPPQTERPLAFDSFNNHLTPLAFNDQTQQQMLLRQEATDEKGGRSVNLKAKSGIHSFVFGENVKEQKIGTRGKLQIEFLWFFFQLLFFFCCYTFKSARLASALSVFLFVLSTKEQQTTFPERFPPF